MISEINSRVRSYLRPIKRTLRIAFYRLLLSVPKGADFYYAFHRQYQREHSITLLAKLRHLEANCASQGVATKKALEFRLRRNVHRLEKGLIMRPRRTVFALDYINETVDLYNSIRSSRESSGAGQESSLEKWSRDVLKRYFEVVGKSEVVDASRKKFEINEVSVDGSADYSPQRLVLEGKLPTPEQFASLARTRKSVRWYQPRTVPRDAIDRAVQLAGLSPSACNRQPFRFVVFDRPEDAAIVGAVPLGTVGFAQNFPCVIVVVGDIGAYFDEKDRHVIYIDAGLASMALQFSFVCDGLGCCCINWPDVASQDKRLRELVKMEPTERAVMLISVGYPLEDGLVPYSAKKEVELLRSYPAIGTDK